MFYRIIQAHSITEMESLIDEKVAEGWQISGGISTVGFPNGVIYFYQAIVKSEIL
jgi:hypothetical protein